MVDLSVIGVFAREEDDSPLLMLHPHGIRRVVCLRVSPVEALTLSMALRERVGGIASLSESFAELAASPVFFGLLSHELMARLVDALGGRLLAVEFPRMEEGNFAAELVLKTSDGFARLACRPADAITLALRCGAIIRMAKHLSAHTQDLDTVMDALSEHVRAVMEDKGSLPVRSGDGGAPSPGGGGERRKNPRIRVSLVRRRGRGEAEVLEEFHFPAEGVPGDVLAALGLSRAEIESVGREPTNDERWAMLLRMLSPETKALM